MNEQEGFSQRLEELKMAIKGLSIEVEGWRQHTGSTGDFILAALRELHVSVNKLQAAIK